VAAALTAASGILAWAFMKETRRRPQAERAPLPWPVGRPGASAARSGRSTHGSQVRPGDFGPAAPPGPRLPVL